MSRRVRVSALKAVIEEKRREIDALHEVRRAPLCVPLRVRRRARGKSNAPLAVERVCLCECMSAGQWGGGAH